MRNLLFTCTPAATILVLALWGWQGLRQEGVALAAKRGALGTSIAESPQNPKATVKGADPLNTTLLAIAAEQAALEKLRHDADEFASRLPAASTDEVIVSYGRIEDMARDAGTALKGLLRALEPNQSDPEVLEQNVLKWMQLKGRIPEIQDFENNPAEIARFQSHALQEALDLSPATEAAVQPLIRDAFATMAAQGLAARQIPGGDAEAWVGQRSQALRQLMLKLRPHIPDSDGLAARQALTFVLNLGAGLETRQDTGPGQGTLTMGVKWPMVPW